MSVLCGDGGFSGSSPLYNPNRGNRFCPLGLLFIMADGVFIFYGKLKAAKAVRSEEVH